MKNFVVILMLFSHLMLCPATIDLTLAELQHLANHLTKDECRKLVSALHFDTFKLSEHTENVENAVPEDVSCLKLLVHWNADEGKGETHTKVSRRLRQMGRKDLAKWLDEAILNELLREINETEKEFKEVTEGRETTELTLTLDSSEESAEEQQLSVSLIGYTMVYLFVVLTLLILVMFCSSCTYGFFMTKDRNTLVDAGSEGQRIYCKAVYRKISETN